MQNVGIVRRSSNQLHHKNHIPSYWGGTSNSSKIKVLEDASKRQDLKYIKLEWRSTQNSISFKKPKRYTPEQKVFMGIGQNMVHQSGAVKQSQKNMDHTGSKEEPESIKFEKPKCSSCKQNEIRSHRKIIFLHTGAAQHHIHEKSKHSTTHHIHKTWNKSE